MQQLIDSKATVNFNQGIDIRIATEDQMQYIAKVKTSTIHMAWDRMKDEKNIIPKLEAFKEITGYNRRKLIVYVLCNYDTTIEQDLHRVMKLREMGFYPYIMLYQKETIPKGHILRKLQRWVNNRFVWEVVETFEEYLKGQ